MINPDLDQLLRRWGRWNRGRLRGPQEPRCGSAESAWLPEAGNTWLTPTELLEQSLRRVPTPEQPLVKVEIVVMRLPWRPRECIRLSYATGYGMRTADKAKVLGIYPDQYSLLLEESAAMVWLRLQHS